MCLSNSSICKFTSFKVFAWHIGAERRWVTVLCNQIFSVDLFFYTLLNFLFLYKGKLMSVCALWFIMILCLCSEVCHLSCSYSERSQKLTDSSYFICCHLHALLQVCLQKLWTKRQWYILQIICWYLNTMLQTTKESN